ncbi:hypothetical protein NDU88_005191, partial [Pleurodeles waltl]
GFLGVPGAAWSGSEGEVLFTRFSWPRISQKQRRRKEQGFLGVPGAAWSGSEGEVLFTRFAWPRISQKQRRRKEQ